MSTVVNKLFRDVKSFDGQPAQKLLVASFHGNGFISEREDDELQIYLVSGEPISTNTVGDAPRVAVDDFYSRNSASAMNQLHEDHARARAALEAQEYHRRR
jgi:hypothetical protein